MKRFITLASAVLLGLASAQTLTTNTTSETTTTTTETTTDTTTPNLQGDFEHNSNDLVMDWDKETVQ